MRIREPRRIGSQARSWLVDRFDVFLQLELNVPLEPLSRFNDVTVLCWTTPTDSDRRALKIASFLGTKTSFVSLAGSVADLASSADTGPQCTCLVVNADTLADAAEAIPTGVAGILDMLGSAARYVFVHGFQPTDRHDALLKGLSSDAVCGVRSASDTDQTFHVADGYREWCGPFSGLSVEHTSRTPQTCFVEREPSSDTLIWKGARPFFVRLAQHPVEVFAAVGELADLDEKASRERPTSTWFAGVAPLLMFLRGALGDRVWHNNRARACFIVDDPPLRNCHGFLDFRQLVGSMKRLHYSTCLAFIPWNYKRSAREAAALFSSSADVLSLCVHGYDHTRGEFQSTDLDSLRDKAASALERMRAHRQLSGVAFDDVMVFPQGLFSVEAIQALRDSDYLAAVNTDVCPATAPDAVTLRDRLDVAVMRFSNFPVFGRHYPNELTEFAFDLFMGKPALAVEHHRFFRDGYAALESFVERLNRLDNTIEWTGLSRICSQACVTRTDRSGTIHVRFFTSRFQISNSGLQTARYVLIRPHHHDVLPAVTVNGHASVCSIEADHVKVTVSLEPGQTADVRVASHAPVPSVRRRRESGLHRVRVAIRRVLSDFRDNHVHANGILNALATTRGQRPQLLESD